MRGFTSAAILRLYAGRATRAGPPSCYTQISHCALSPIIRVSNTGRWGFEHWRDRGMRTGTGGGISVQQKRQGGAEGRHTCCRVLMRGSLSNIIPSLSLSSFSTRSCHPQGPVRREDVGARSCTTAALQPCFTAVLILFPLPCVIYHPVLQRTVQAAVQLPWRTQRSDPLCRADVSLLNPLFRQL